MTHEENCPGGICDCDNPVPISRPVTPHDKLLDAIKPEYAYGKIGDALRAVVELHKPLTTPNNFTHCPHCQYGSAAGSYPCPTIQAIEKELQ